jgi:xanthine dehydrogenase accessory factor
LTAMVRGAGELASGAAISLHRAGFAVVMTELSEPLAIRRTVCFSEAVYDGEQEVEGIRAVRTDGEGISRALRGGEIAILVDPQAAARLFIEPDVLVDGIMAKFNSGTFRGQAPVVIALGPGFRAGADADAVIETARGHELGRVILRGERRGTVERPVLRQGAAVVEGRLVAHAPEGTRARRCRLHA